MTFPEVIKYLDSFIDYEKIPQYPYKQSLRLERIEEFLKILNNPQDDLKCIHIAGTKGKGSACAFIAYILREAGFKVGLYTSPHLSDFRERIRILEPKTDSRKPNTEHRTPNTDFEGMISEKELIDLVEEARFYIEEFNSQSKHGPLSFFEVYTALAFQYFKQRKVDFVVLETGLGGRLDATNTVNSLIAAITPISYEHIRQLGQTLTEIAQEKAGIIKAHRSQVTSHRSIVISTPQEGKVIEVIKESCRQQGALLYEIGKDIIIEQDRPYQSPQCFNLNGVFGRLTDLKIRLLGRHQVINAALAVTVVLALSKFYQVRLNPVRKEFPNGVGLSNRVNPEAIKNGLYNTTWPGRFEIIQAESLVVLDGAQNSASAWALHETVIKNFPGKRTILVLGISQDKDIEGICKELCPLAKEIILTQADNPRAADVDVIEQVVRSKKQEATSKIFKTKNAKEAIELALKEARREDLVLVTGSLFLVGEVRSFLLKNRDILPMGKKGVPWLVKRVSLERW